MRGRSVRAQNWTIVRNICEIENVIGLKSKECGAPVIWKRVFRAVRFGMCHMAQSAECAYILNRAMDNGVIMLLISFILYRKNAGMGCFCTMAAFCREMWVQGTSVWTASVVVASGEAVSWVCEGSLW